MTSRYLLPVLFLLSILYPVSAADDGAAMLSLATSLRPLPSKWSTTTSAGFCKWTGIKCGHTGRVISINLSDESLSGEISPEISALSELKNLSLQRNSLSGKIPPFANLPSLEKIYLDQNSFDGIAHGAFSNLSRLQILSLSDNAMLKGWNFPQELVDSAFLNNIYLDNTGLSGSLPDVFDSFGILQTLRLSNNNLTGQLPPSLAKSTIRELLINNQYLGMSGTIDVLSAMTSLTRAWLHKNRFSGPIPDISKSNSLFDLQLHQNNLTGPIPLALTSMPNLRLIDISNNNLTGEIPEFATSVKFNYKPGNALLGLKSGETGSGGTARGDGIRKSVGLIAAIVLPVMVLLAVACFVVYKYKNGALGNGRGNSATRDSSNNTMSSSNKSESENGTISIEVLRQATDNFNQENILLGSENSSIISE